MGRYVEPDPAPPPRFTTRDEFNRLRRTLLESVDLGSPAGRDHEVRLLKAGPGLEDRMRVYEETLRRAGAKS